MRVGRRTHVLDVQVDQFGEGPEAAEAGVHRRLAAVDLALRVEGPTSRLLASQEGLAYIASLAADLDAPVAGLEFSEGGHFRVRSVCVRKSKSVDAGRST